MGFFGGSAIKNLPAMQETQRLGFDPQVWKLPCGRKWNPLQYSCWEIPWTEKPGRQQSMGLQRVKHNLVTKQQQQQQHYHKKTGYNDMYSHI